MRRTANGLVDNEYRVVAVLLGARSSVSIGEILAMLADRDPRGRLMNEATVYRITRRLMDRGWVTAEWRTTDIDARPKREFFLTPEGAPVAQEQLKTYLASRDVSWA